MSLFFDFAPAQCLCCQHGARSIRARRAAALLRCAFALTAMSCPLRASAADVSAAHRWSPLIVAAAKSAPPADIARLVEQLGSDRAADRAAAVRTFAGYSQENLQTARALALRTEPNARGAGFDALGRWIRSEDAVEKEATRAALHSIAAAPACDRMARATAVSMLDAYNRRLQPTALDELVSTRPDDALL
jgi:hypothetical protein